MKIQKKWLYILLAAAGVFGVVTILFFSGEKWLRDGWYYIPDRAIAIALGLCVFWQIVLTAGTFFCSCFLHGTGFFTVLDLSRKWNSMMNTLPCM